MMVFKMRESVPTARYSPVCNVLRQWKTSLILTYRVYRLYDNSIEIPIYYATPYTIVPCHVLIILLMYNTIYCYLNAYNNYIR